MRYHKKAGYDISILSILGIDSFFEQQEIHKNTKHGTFIVATFECVDLRRPMIDVSTFEDR